MSKTFTLPDDLADSLISIGKELSTQDSLHTSYPIWYVTEDVEVEANSDNCEFRKRKNLDFIDYNDFCDSCKALYENDDTLPDDCGSCPDDLFYYGYIERQYASYGSVTFLTQKACQQHINTNSYHYRNPRPYADSLHRNYEMQDIIKGLILMAGCEIPSHYGGHK